MDDDESSVEALKATLEEEKLNVAGVCDGPGALTAASEFQPDLILLDIIMPGMDGFETFRKLKADDRTRDIPVIFLTAKTDWEDISKGYSLGCEDYILKPFHIDEVCSRIRTQLLLNRGRSREKSRAEANSLDTEGMKVLIVDDISQNIDILIKTLEPEKYNFSVAPNGKVALDISSRFLPDLILMDVMMPEMDGFEACKKLKEDDATREIPIIFITAKNQPEDIDKGFALGGVDYIPKPFRDKEVLARVKAHLRLKKLLMEREAWLNQLQVAKQQLKENILEKAGIFKEVKTRLQKELAEKEFREREILSAKKEAEEANRAKTEFLTRMSHELRTPLSAILGFSQLLEMGVEGSLTASQKTNVDYIIKAGNHLLSLINEALDLGEVESGKVKLNIQKVNISVLVEDKIIPMVSSMREEKKITLTNQIPDGQDFYVLADPIRLIQILVNLIINAMKYNNDGGIVTLGAGKSDNSVLITVADNGPGISKSDLDKIFEPFVRLAPESSEVTGTGIGLTIVKRFTELMGGEISVQSVLGEGACFTIKLPAG